jgi:beta propeller repeat protein
MKRIFTATLAAILASTLLTGSLSGCAPNGGSEPPDNSWEIEGRWRYSTQSISGDTLVAGEYVGDSGLEAMYITAYDLRTREKKRLNEIPLDCRFEAPCVSGVRVAWAQYDYSDEFKSSMNKDFYSLDWEVFLLNMSTGEIRQITDDDYVQKSVRISGNTIVWLDNRNEENDEYPHYFDVYAYDLKTGEEKRITSDCTVTDTDLAISGSTIVWTDNRNDDPTTRIQTHPPVSNDDIYLYDLSTGQEVQVTNSPACDSSPVIDNGRIVWERRLAARGCDIYLYDIETGEEARISNSGYVAGLYYPAISGDRIVWADSRLTEGNSSDDCYTFDEESGTAESGSAEIFLYDLSTGEETLIVASEGLEYTENHGGKQIKSTAWEVWLNPVMSGDYLIYELSRQIGSVTHVMKLED